MNIFNYPFLSRGLFAWCIISIIKDRWTITSTKDLSSKESGVLLSLK
jgi:hypothetical protein